MKNNICIYRHGLTDYNMKNKPQGWNDIKLNIIGIYQVKKTIKNLSSFKWDLIISSDLKRTKQTAKIIGKKLKIPIIYDWRIREKRFGSKQYNKEEKKDFINRIMSFINDLYKLNAFLDCNIIIVTHGGVIKEIGKISKVKFNNLGNSEYVIIEKENIL